MSWVRLDDGFHDHRKTLSVSLEAIGLYTLGLTWTSKHGLNGLIPHHVTRTLGRGNCSEQVKELLSVGLWHDDGTHYVVNDFLDYNPSAKSKARKQKEARERMRSLRARSRGVRANNSATCAHVLRGRDGKGTGSVSGSSPDARARDFEAFWAAYPRRKAKKAAQVAWGKLAPDAELAAAIVAAVTRQAASPDWQRDGGQYIPHAATWLNGRRWEDELLSVEPRRLESKRTQGNLAVLREFAEAGQ